MASREKVVLYGGLAFAVLAVYWWLSSSDDVRPQVKRTHHAQSAVVGDQDQDAVSSYVGPAFPKPNGKLRDVFMPVATPGEDDKTKSSKLEKVPSNLSGDGNWIFTGIADVSGSKEALLENSSKHEYGFVHEGQVWKRCHIGQITPDKVSFFGPDGIETVVFRFNPSDQTKGQPTKEAVGGPTPNQGGVAPVQPHPNMSGPIGMPQVQEVESDGAATAGG
ncbi:MAG TPA: hypothetical protein VGL56_08070 [Fimbriimonadaceae bacterium]|jgi:hypothetical protein